MLSWPRLPCYTLPMTAKVCPRCGSQYENFKSTTCPQCFAILVAVDEETAAEMTAARADVERSPEFQETKRADDERFRQQSFGACLGIAALTLATLIIAAALLVSAAHRRTAQTTRPADDASCLGTAGPADDAARGGGDARRSPAALARRVCAAGTGHKHRSDRNPDPAGAWGIREKKPPRPNSGEPYGRKARAVFSGSFPAPQNWGGGAFPGCLRPARRASDRRAE